LAAHNAARYEKDLADWEAVQVIHRLHATRGQTGGRAQFKHDEDHGAFVRKDGKGGIDWYRYQVKIIKERLLPFARTLIKKYGVARVRKDNAGPHASHYNVDFWKTVEVLRLDWCANSPHLNAIEPTWFWMKRETTNKNGPLKSNDELKKAWIKCWEDIPQEKIQALLVQLR
jgi:hypothetical protein